jgi:hypothetical protein
MPARAPPLVLISRMYPGHETGSRRFINRLRITVVGLTALTVRGHDLKREVLQRPSGDGGVACSLSSPRKKDGRNGRSYRFHCTSSAESASDSVPKSSGATASQNRAP